MENKKEVGVWIVYDLEANRKIQGFFLAILFIPLIEMDTYESALKTASLDVCRYHNSTYKDTEFSRFTHITIICTDMKIRLP